MSEVQASNKYAVPALEKSVAILEYLAAQGSGGHTLSEISQALAVPKTSAFAILNTLEHHNLVRKSSDGQYTLSLRLFSLGMSALRNFDINKTIVPHMERLRDETNFTVHLAGHDHGEQICLAKMESRSMVRFSSYVGQRKRMNTTACGKAIAAYLSEGELRHAVGKGFDICTPNSIADEPTFRGHLADIRKSGYAVDDEEGEFGVRCIGIPLFMPGGVIFGAISLSTLKNNLSLHVLQQLSARMIETGARVSAELGYAGPYPPPHLRTEDSMRNNAER